MNYYKWLEADDIDSITPWVLRTLYIDGKKDGIGGRGIREWDLRKGKYIDIWDPQNLAEYELDGHRDDFVSTAFYIPVVSPALKTLLERLAPDEIQFLPLQIRKIGGNGEVKGYHIANFLHMVDCIDRELSKYLEWKPGDSREDLIGKSFRDMEKIVLKGSSIGNHKIFRLTMWDIVMVVSEEIVVAIEEAGLTGSKFRKLETIS
jgi:hypothetical protein